MRHFPGVWRVFPVLAAVFLVAARPFPAQAGNANIGELRVTMAASAFNAVNTAESNPKVKRSCTVAFKYPGDSANRFSAGCEIRNHGGGAVYLSGKKRTFRLKFKSNYGPTRLNYPVFERAPLNKSSAATSGFDNLVLRGGGNDATQHDWAALIYKSLIKDEWIRATQIACSGVGSHGTFVNLYVNGSYWGLYNLVERPDCTFASQYLGGTKDQWASKRAHSGDLSRWNTMLSRAEAGNFSGVQDYLDLDNFVDYIIIGMYFGHWDWSFVNSWNATKAVSGGKTYWFHWDGEMSFNGANNNMGYPPKKYWPPGAQVTWSELTRGHDDEYFRRIWQGLIGNSGFKAVVNERAHALLKNGGPLTDAPVKARLDTLKAFIQNDIQPDLTRWSSYLTKTQWANDVASLRGHVTGTADRLFTKMKDKGWVTDAPAPQPAIAVSTTSLATSCEQGQNAPSRTFEVWNSGTGTLAYKITESSSSLSVSPTTGSSTGTTDKKTHTISFTTSGLAVGTHQRTITIEDNGSGALNTETITVTITVSAPALPPTAPSGLVATAQSTSEILVTWQDNSGSEEAYKLDRRVSGATSWVRVVQTAANDTSHTDSGLSAETKYYYKVKAWKADGGDSAYSNIDDATTDPDVQPAIAVSTASLATSCEQGQNAPSRTFEVWNSGTGTLAYSVLAPSSKVNPSPDNGTSTGVGDKVLHTVTFSTADLAPGVYDRLITIEDNGSGALNSPVTIAVQITVTAVSGPDTVVAKGSTWTYRHGTAEASAPAAAWRGGAFDDSGWSTGAAPFGYGGASYGTDLSAMQDDHVSVFLRKTFTLEDPAQVEQIALDVDYDDGFVLWLNGQELARVNVAGAAGEPVPYDQAASAYVSAASEDWSATLQGGALPPLGAENVLAVQVMNIGPNSGDLMMDVEVAVLCSQLATADDQDDNNLPDDWDQAWLSDLTDPTDRTDQADPDGDGVSNYGEWVCGTDPVSETGNLKLETGLNGGQLEVRFPALVAAGAGYDGWVRHYTLETREGGPAGTWSKVPGYEDLTVTTDQTISYQPAATGAPAVYRARCWLE